MVAGSLYLVQTVSSQRRPWSSYSDIRGSSYERELISNKPPIMNGHICSPLMARRPAGTSYDFPEKEIKKDKKWSFGNIFRRKKKNVSESSSEEENSKMSFLHRRKKKNNSTKKKTKQGVFDHVVIPHNSRGGTYSTLNTYRSLDDPCAIFSDPTFDASIRSNSYNVKPENSVNQYLNVHYPSSDRSDVNISRNSLASVESYSRKNRKELAKARAEARRVNLKYESSSDDESQPSGCSSAAKLRSDESLSKYCSLSKRSRGARTERYLRRHSKDEDLKCLENGRLRSRSPSKIQKNQVPYLPNYNSFDTSGLLTIPPSHNTNKRNRNFTVTTCCFEDGVLNDPTATTNQRSMSYESHMNHSSSNDIIHGRLPLGIPTCGNGKTPPLPPPRDPRRVVAITAYDSSRPNSFCVETAIENRNGVNRNRSPMLIHDKRVRNTSDITGMMYAGKFRSTSEDQIPIEPVVHSLTVRPASTTPETSNKTNDKDFSMFVTDSQPRSRKPLSVHSFIRSENINNFQNGRSKAYQTFNFWKQKEDEVKRHKSEPITKILPKSPVLACKSPVSSNKRFTCVDINKSDVPQSALLVSAITKSPVEKVRGFPREPSPFRPISPVPKISLKDLTRSKSVSPGLNYHDSEALSEKCSSPNVTRKKPENLEDALNELEEIYNSLRLGDEELLDRAEKREADICKEVATNLINNNKKTKRHSSRMADVKEDDLAFRKYCKERSKTIGDPHSVASSISYLLSSPLSGDLLDEPKRKNKKEPDITFDDVLYRNIKQTNNSLKIVDPQPPFGIPLRPISSAPNSDYLHADPEVGKREKVSKKIPDIVKDDLAYRSLRKDSNKEPALPASSPVGDANNNKTFNIPSSKYSPNGSFKKNRAVRSLSANIFNLMQKDRDDRINSELEIAQSLTEIADAMEQTRLMLKEQDKNITKTRKGFVSDGEAFYNGQYSPRMDAMVKHRANFLDEMKSFDISSSQTVDNNENVSSDDSNANPKTLDELLTALAVETRETSDRITKELRMLDENDILKKPSQISKELETESVKTDEVPEKNEDSVPKDALDVSDDVIPAVVEEMNVSESPKQTDVDDFIPVELITRTLSNDSTDKADHAKMCEKLLECVVENAEIVSDEVESDHVQNVAEINTDEETVASVVLIPNEDKVLSNPDPIEAEVYSEPDYENLKCSEDSDRDNSDVDNKCTVSTSDEGKTTNKNSDVEDSNQNVDDHDCTTNKGEDVALPCVANNNNSASLMVCANSAITFPTNDITNHLFVNNSCQSPHENVKDNQRKVSIDYSLENLVSPNLVKEAVCSSSVSSASSTYSLSEVLDGNDKNGKSITRPDSDLQSGTAWYKSPLSLTLACSYGIACTYTLTALDLAALCLIVIVISIIISLLKKQ